ncbi:MAG: hypothetical protein GVY20_11020 [Bacteroidetes bacterium]|jgi:hypothetical protein|nr:hypothetical protein [Bacteroidota bacterium]
MTLKKIGLFISITMIPCLIFANPQDKDWILQNDQVRIVFDNEGHCKQIENLRSGVEYVDKTIEELWRIILKFPDSGDKMSIMHNGQEGHVEQTGDTLKVVYPDISMINRDIHIALTISVWLKGDEIHMKADLANNGWGQITALEFPKLVNVTELETDNQNIDYLYWPYRPGQRFERPVENGLSLRSQYPGLLTMQWMGYANDDNGLYIASLDSTLQTTHFDASSGDGLLSFQITKYPHIEQGEKWSSAPFVISPHQGSWHVAADKYRKWADTWMQKAPVPEWVQNSNGWFLTIMKQQNGNKMWDYDEIPQIHDIAQQQGINTVSLFGWAIGGHDHMYPDYSPDPRMGTLKDITESAEILREKGGRSILFANGQLVDRGGEFYKKIGHEYSAIKEDGSEYREYWRKYHNHTGYVNAVMCPSTEVWRQKLIEIGEYVANIGVDGLIYDQIGFGGPTSDFCYNESHNHSNPALAIGAGIYENIQEIRKAVKKINPEFSLVAEGINDAIVQYVDFVHGSGAGYEYHKSSFPAMFRYTFPEIIFTNRYSSPYMGIEEANFTVLNGMRFDVESRYTPDVKLLTEGIRPTREDYENIWWRPNDVGMLINEPVESYGEYLKELSEIRNEHKILLTGKFTDSKGFELSNRKVTAKSFVQDNEMAVIVWNETDTTQSLKVNTPGYTLTTYIVPKEAHSNPSIPLEPNQLAIYLGSRQLKEI